MRYATPIGGEGLDETKDEKRTMPHGAQVPGVAYPPCTEKCYMIPADERAPGHPQYQEPK